MKKIMALLLLFGVIGCSKSPSTLIVICEGGANNYFDEAYTFNFDTGEIQMSKSLNAYGSEQKSLIYERLDSNIESGYASKDSYEFFDDLFLEENSTFVIRNLSDGFITFGYAIDVTELIDIEWTLNRASLQLKRVMNVKKSLIPEGVDTKPETTDFMDCKKPSV